MNKYNDFSNIIQTDDNFNVELEAYNISLREYTKDDIIRILAENNDEKKIVAIINLKSIENKFEADLILSHLTGQDGRIREAVSYILSELNPSDFYLDEKSINTLLNGILDINPNVVRNLISFINKSPKLKENLIKPIVIKTNEILSDLEKYVKCDSPFFEN